MLTRNDERLDRRASLRLVQRRPHHDVGGPRSRGHEDLLTVDDVLVAVELRHPGPGIGLIIGWIAVILLTFHWARVVWSRTAVHLAAEEARRRAAAEEQSKKLLETLDDDKPDGEQ